MKDQLTVMAGPKKLLEEKADELNSSELREIAEKWQYSVNKIEKTLKALNFRTNSIMTMNEIFSTVNILTLAKSSCILKETPEIVSANCESKYLVYMLSEIVMYLYENDVSEAEIAAKKGNGYVVVTVNKPCKYSESIIKRLNNITRFDRHITVNINDDLLEIIIN